MIRYLNVMSQADRESTIEHVTDRSAAWPGKPALKIEAAKRKKNGGTSPHAKTYAMISMIGRPRWMSMRFRPGTSNSCESRPS